MATIWWICDPFKFSAFVYRINWWNYVESENSCYVLIFWAVFSSLLQLNHADDLASSWKKVAEFFDDLFQQSATIYFNENWFINYLSRSLLLQILQIFQMEEWNRFFTSVPCNFQSFKNHVLKKNSLTLFYVLYRKSCSNIIKSSRKGKNGKYI